MRTSGRTRIIIVEDDTALLRALTFALEAEGYAVSAYGAAEPLLRQSREADCLVVDLKLPDMDGLALIKRLRAGGLESPAILITTDPSARCRRSAAEAKVTIVEKPLIGGELRERIADALRSSNGAG